MPDDNEDVPPIGSAAGLGYRALPPPAHRRPWNGFAITSFVLGLVTCGLGGLIFGVLALRTLNRDRDQRGRGLAIASIVLSVVWLGVGAFTLPGRLHRLGGVFALKVGDCFNEPARRNMASTDVAAVPCTRPHQAEVIGRLAADRAPYAEAEDLDSDMRTTCRPKLDEYVLDPLTLPDEAGLGWYYRTGPDLTIVCVLRMNGGTLARPLRADTTTLTADQVRYLAAVHDFDSEQRRMFGSDAALPFVSRRVIATDLAIAEEKELALLRQGPWAPAAQAAIDALIAVKEARIPLWRQAGQSTTEPQYRALLDRAVQHDDHAAALAARQALGLPIRQGEPIRRP